MREIQAGQARPRAYVVAGDYDDDGVQDPAVYNQDSATFEILRSGSGHAPWPPRTFPSSLIPQDSLHDNFILGQADRAGPIPLEGTGVYLFSRPSVYSPHLGTWHTMWDVAGNGPVASCLVAFGEGQDWFPISPNVDRDNDGRSDMVLFKAADFVTPAALRFYNSGGGTCVASQTVSFPALKRPRLRAFWAGEMTGDGKNELMIFDPDRMEFHWATSESDYATLQTKQLGSPHAIAL
jgi:hypothetical protein